MDDTKCFMIVEKEEERKKFLSMQMAFNIDKCHDLHAGKKNAEHNYRWGLCFSG